MYLLLLFVLLLFKKYLELLYKNIYLCWVSLFHSILSLSLNLCVIYWRILLKSALYVTRVLSGEHVTRCTYIILLVKRKFFFAPTVNVLEAIINYFTAGAFMKERGRYIITNVVLGKIRKTCEKAKEEPGRIPLSSLW